MPYPFTPNVPPRSPTMERASTSSERSPLVPPTYVFESSVTRRYQKRLRAFQCAICVSLVAFLGVALLITASYSLSDEFDADADNATEAPAPAPSPAPAPPGPLNLSAVPPDMAPLLQLSWPLKGKDPSPWVGDPPTPAAITSAVTHGKAALHNRTVLESLRTPLQVDSPAGRAQRAAATAREVKPMADAAYAVEQATRALANGTDLSNREGGVGVGPAVNGSFPFPEPPYCGQATPPCPPSKYRTLNGTCNNPNYPLRWGVSNTPFRRVLPAVYADGISAPRTGADGSPLPSARDVSVTVHRPSYAHDVSFTVMLAVWGQFIDHDITATALNKGTNSTPLSCCGSNLPPHPECFPVPLDVEDPFYQQYNLTCMEFVRSAPAYTCHYGPRNQMNQATAFLDGSTVYGYTASRANRLRTFVGGRLKMLTVGSRELLPPSTDPNDGCNTVEMNAKGRYCFESGDDRANENLHLTTMHLIWARQHNRLAGALQRLNPAWDDATLFQEARKIVGAQMQHITYSEFLPIILGNDVMWSLNLTLQDSGHSELYDPAVDPSIANHFSAAAFRFAHTLLPGLIHHVDLSTGSVSYTQLHQLLFNPYMLYTTRGGQESMQSAMSTRVHAGGGHVTTELSNHLFERPIPANASIDAATNTTATKPGPCGLDLVSLNIQRGRDHGLPSYPAWREHCGFERPKTMDDLSGVMDDESLSRITTIYKSVDDIDLYTGALGEDPRGRLLGPTFTCLVADQFLRLKRGDRYWYETADEEAGFTIEQLTELRKTTLAGVICANEDLLDQAQPRVMEVLSPTNPLVDCMELLQPDLAPWRDPAAAGTGTKAKKEKNPAAAGSKGKKGKN
ncbi:unnamed protein product [Plutella xylostella]|uniref:(diamondback moth) hypothetical protein n=1 Tax=Plutella xylostella TaxID=51655 RepID=A0A8S4FVV4_PLUXY|nr:unnamed protein product [Plutella xylostella]